MFNFFRKDPKPTPIIPSAVEPTKLCPYCKQAFEKNPTKKTKCPSCKKYVPQRTCHLLTVAHEKKKIDIMIVLFLVNQFIYLISYFYF